MGCIQTLSARAPQHCSPARQRPPTHTLALNRQKNSYPFCLHHPLSHLARPPIQPTQKTTGLSPPMLCCARAHSQPITDLCAISRSPLFVRCTGKGTKRCAFGPPRLAPFLFFFMPVAFAIPITHASARARDLQQHCPMMKPSCSRPQRHPAPFPRRRRRRRVNNTLVFLFSRRDASARLL